VQQIGLAWVIKAGINATNAYASNSLVLFSNWQTFKFAGQYWAVASRCWFKFHGFFGYQATGHLNQNFFGSGLGKEQQMLMVKFFWFLCWL
jgi:hypothetical protein